MTKAEWTHLYLCVGFWMSAASVVIRACYLGWKEDYPREVTWSRGEDAFWLLYGVMGTICASEQQEQK